MRRKFDNQTTLFNIQNNSQIARELEGMSLILDANPGQLDLVFADITKNRRQDTGREGMSAEQVLRCAIVKQYRQLSYEELEFHLEDSWAFRAFARLGLGQYPCKSILQGNIKSITAETWEAVHQQILAHAMRTNIENGKQVRLDSTVVESDIHHPMDSTLLEDGIRVVTKLLTAGKGLYPAPAYAYADHTRVAKKRVTAIRNTKKATVRKKAYQDLLHYANRVRGYLSGALSELKKYDVLMVGSLVIEMERVDNLLAKVIDQTVRRVLKDEKVLAGDKVVSFFEDHTDIIVKDKRETQFGHKIFLSGGASGMILDCMIEKGNPADTTLYQKMLDRHGEMYGKLPRQVSADGGFASAENLEYAKSSGVKDAVFAKKRGLNVLEMAKSTWVYKKLRNFRAGIEACISVLKRAFGLDRCTWTGWDGFNRYVWSSVIAYNLLTMARIGLSQG
jgi:IS5 family transposase